MTRVFLVDDHEIVRQGIARILGDEPGLEVVGESGTLGEAFGRIRATAPDVVVLDVRLPDGSGIDLCRRIRSELPASRCLILTAFDDDTATRAAVVAGASGYLLKSVLGTSIAESVLRVGRGEDLIPASVTARVRAELEARAGERLPTPADLTLRERQALRLIAEGLTNRQIGERLGLAEKTVKNYVTGLLAKLGMERRTQAAVYGAAVGSGAPSPRSS